MAEEAKVISEERKEQLIQQEISACQALLDKHGKQSYLRDMSVGAYVRRCYIQKQALIEQFDGWRYHANVDMGAMIVGISDYEIDKISADTIKSHYCIVAIQDWRQIYRICQNKLANEAMELVLYNKTHMHMPDYSYCSCSGCRELNCNLAKASGRGLTIHIRKGQSIAKAVLAKMEKNDSLNYWQSFFERLGKLWARNDKTNYGLTISCAPSSFWRLGHYGENSSCYKFGGEWQYSKGVLAQLPRSVVYLFYEGAEEIVLGDNSVRKGSVIGRAWGNVGDAVHPSFIMTNTYLIPIDIARKIVILAIGEAFGMKYEDWEEFEPSSGAICGYQSDKIYLNSDTFGMKGEAAVAAWFAEQNRQYDIHVPAGLDDEDDEDEDMYSCEICGDRYHVDDMYYCSRCNVYVCRDHCGYDEIDCRYYCPRCASIEECESCHVIGSSRSLVALTEQAGWACEDCVLYCEYGDCGNGFVGRTDESHNCVECELVVCQSCFDAHAAKHVPAEVIV